MEGLQVWDDAVGRSAAANMALDEALACLACVPVLRVYRWAAPAITYGYFCDYSEVEPFLSGRDHARRWTGGGIVEHGADVTLALVIPRRGAWAGMRPADLYCWLHRSIRDSMQNAGVGIALASATPHPGPPAGACFSSPVASDLMWGDVKIGGGAVRRTRDAILYQGSLQGVAAAHFSLVHLWSLLSGHPVIEGQSDLPAYEATDALAALANRLLQSKYATAGWNERREVAVR